MEMSCYTLSSSKFPPKQVQTSSSNDFVSPVCFSYSSNLRVVHFSNRKNVAKRTQLTAKPQRKFSFSAVARAESITTDDTTNERWLLEPIGDGDSRHIGFEVAMPGAFEIASSTVTVGRVPEKADLVIPVATVSGLHARIQKKGKNLLVTDMDSTNGTFVGERRLKPGVTIRISSGSSITFGDTHLAMFRVSRLENTEISTKLNDSEVESESSELTKAESESTEASIISETS